MRERLQVHVVTVSHDNILRDYGSRTILVTTDWKAATAAAVEAQGYKSEECEVEIESLSLLQGDTLTLRVDHRGKKPRGNYGMCLSSPSLARVEREDQRLERERSKS